ncbi:WAT1-related protein At1g43650-like [Henckelia pumila]|uniref:WAT1-related protein At1g43650-like n=1 Tax=Henckelia pumila TaxID=405737 RepID=UPI003C6E3A5E
MESRGKNIFIVIKKNPYIAVIFMQFAYAGMALLSKAAISQGMNPYVFVAYRQAFATIALAPFAYFLERKEAADPLPYLVIGKIFLISLLGSTLSMNLYSYAINYVSATFASASINTIPALTFVLSVIFRIESLSITRVDGIAKVVGTVISVSGAVVFALVKGPQVNFMNWSSEDTHAAAASHLVMSAKDKLIQGCLLMILANAAWAWWLVMQAPLVKRYPAKFRLTLLQSLFSCMQSFVWAMAMERNLSTWKLQWDLNLISVAYCGVVVTGLVYWLQLCAVESKGPLFTASFTPLALIITAFISALVWKEILHLGSICGGILLVGGLYCVLWGKNKEVQVEANKDQQADSKAETIV